MKKSYFSYWGKYRKNDDTPLNNHHPLAYHCLDVAAVAFQLFSPQTPLIQDIAQLLNIPPAQAQRFLAFFVALHDIGKFSSAFQNLYVHQDPRLIRGECSKQYDGKAYRHDRLALYFWQDKQINALLIRLISADISLPWQQLCTLYENLQVLIRCVFGHHGKPILEDSHSAMAVFIEPHNITAAHEFISDVALTLAPDFPNELLTAAGSLSLLQQISWILAGAVVLADWIGSDANYFPYHANAELSLSEYWAVALTQAQQALQALRLDQPPKIKPFLSVYEHYGFQPSPLQHWAETVSLDNSPQLFILEDITGAGKTEAALVLAHRLMQMGAAQGFYFGLPTMATSNAMFHRVAQHYHQMLQQRDGDPPSIVLAHGARDMNPLFQSLLTDSSLTIQEYTAQENSASAQCNQWFANSAKKALLAPVGVGTIDQALVAVLPRHYQSLRVLGLHRKLLIIDEVHSADEFMLELLESLLAWHLQHGGSAILLTATLSLQQREKLLRTWLNTPQSSAPLILNQAFPLATRAAFAHPPTLSEYPLESRPELSRCVKVEFVFSRHDCINLLLNAVAQGQCAVWICNSVEDAVEVHQLLTAQLADPTQCLLFHSRFVLHDRANIEEQVLATFGKQSSAPQRSGKILIATQVFQESLDADADLMISDLCPIDDLIQRAGRLQRHSRNAQRQYQPNIKDSRSAAILYLHTPQFVTEPASDWLSRDFKRTQSVYRSAGRLWLGLRELSLLKGFRLPQDARRLIEAVYHPEASQQIPTALQAQEKITQSEQLVKKAKARSQILPWRSQGYNAKGRAAHWYEDNYDISTRYNDVVSLEVVLFKQDATGQVQFWIEDSTFALQLSTLKLPEFWVEQLTPPPEALLAQIEPRQKQYYRLKNMRTWFPELDPLFSYSAQKGFYTRKS